MWGTKGAEEGVRKERDRDRDMRAGKEPEAGSTGAGTARLLAFPTERRLRRTAETLLERLSGLVPFDAGLAFLGGSGGERLRLLAAWPEGLHSVLQDEMAGACLPATSQGFEGGENGPGASRYEGASDWERGSKEGASPLFLKLASRLGLHHFDVYDFSLGHGMLLYLLLGDRGEDRSVLRPQARVLDLARRTVENLGEEGPGESRSARYLRALVEVSRALSEETDTDALVHRVLGIVEELTGARLSYVMLVDPENRSRLRGVLVKVGEELVRLDPGMRNALYRKAQEKGLDPLIAAMEDCVSPGVVSEGTHLLVVPIRLEGELLGMMKCALPGQDLDETDLEFLRALASQLAAGIKISDHYRRLQEREEGLSGLNALLTSLSDCLFREEMLDYLAQGLGPVLGASEVILVKRPRAGGAGGSLSPVRWHNGPGSAWRRDRVLALMGTALGCRTVDDGEYASIPDDGWLHLRRQDLVRLMGGSGDPEELGMQEAFLFLVGQHGEEEVWCAALSHREGAFEGDRLRSLSGSLVGTVQSSFLRAAFYEEALNEESKLIAVFNAIQDAVLLVDGTGRLVAANQVADRLFGLRRRGLLGRTPGPEELFPDLHSFIFTPGGDEDSGRELVVPVDPPRYVRAYRSRARLPGGEEVGEVVVLRDVTDERELELVKDDFLACVSHELRTPLSVVLGYLEILTDNWERLDEESRRDAVRHTRRAAERLKGVIGDILDAARASRRELELRRSPLRVDLLAEEVTRQARVADGAHAYVFVRREGSCLAAADETKLRRALWNLLDNARKFSPPGSEITVTVGRRSDGVFLSVRDRGVGISPWHQPLVFRRFTQVDRGDARRSSGLGIGLYLVKEIVELHGGKVELESEPERGTVFTLVLPPGPIGNLGDGTGVETHEGVDGLTGTLVSPDKGIPRG
jgi:signal transduction histidine kinase